MGGRSPGCCSANLRAARSNRAWVARAVRGVFSEGFQTTELPQTRARAAFQLQTATGKLKAEMMPVTPRGCHCSIMRWWGRSDWTVRPPMVAGESGGEDADVDHLLDLATAFGEDLSGLDGDEAAEWVEVGAELFAEEADELSAAGHGDGAPVEEGLVGGPDGGAGIGRDGDVGEVLAGDGGAGGEGAAGEGGLGDAEVEEEVAGFVAEGGGVGGGLEDSLGAHGRYRAFREVFRFGRRAPPSLTCGRDFSCQDGVGRGRLGASGTDLRKCVFAAVCSEGGCFAHADSFFLLQRDGRLLRAV